MATYYVTAGASGGGVGSEGDPYTLTEAIDNVAANDTVWIKADAAYTTEYATGGAKSSIFYLTTNGTLTQPIRWAGYKTTIGDGGQVADVSHSIRRPGGPAARPR